MISVLVQQTFHVFVVEFVSLIGVQIHGASSLVMFEHIPQRAVSSSHAYAIKTSGLHNDGGFSYLTWLISDTKHLLLPKNKFIRIVRRVSQGFWGTREHKTVLGITGTKLC